MAELWEAALQTSSDFTSSIGYVDSPRSLYHQMDGVRYRGAHLGLEEAYTRTEPGRIRKFGSRIHEVLVSTPPEDLRSGMNMFP